MNDQRDFIFTRSFINGAWCPESGTVFPVNNPFDGSLVASVQDDDVLRVEEAIAAAHQAFPNWKALAAAERAGSMMRLYELMHAHLEALARLMTLESGKPITESRAEVRYAAAFIQWFSEEAKRAYGDIIPGYTADRRVMVLKEPVGVVGILTPWNFPLAMITRKLGPALAVGCSVVIRPSVKTPLSALALAHLSALAGFPAGVINVIAGSHSSETGKRLCADPRVAKISFTGSTPVGRLLMEQCAPGLKKLSLELGGNAPVLVFSDADLDAAVRGIIAAKFRFSGQTCVCVNRILVQKTVYESFMEKFIRAVKELKTGDGKDESTAIGPLIDEKASQHCRLLIEDALEKGGVLRLGGKALSKTLFPPTVLSGASEHMRLAQEEIFGPVAAVFAFSSDQQGIEMANNTQYGLAAYLYTRDLQRSWRVSEALQYGIVGVNEAMISSETVPFGGVKQSGMGREGSKYGLSDYQQIKYVCLGQI